MNRHVKPISAAKYFLVAFLLSPFLSYSQIPSDLPKPQGPVDVSETSNLVLYIIIPAIILIIYFIFRKRIRRSRNK